MNSLLHPALLRTTVLFARLGALAVVTFSTLLPTAALAAFGTQARDERGKLMYMVVATGTSQRYASNSRTGTPIVDPGQFGKIYGVGQGGFKGPDAEVDGKLIEALDANLNIVGYFRGEEVIYHRLQALQAPKADGSGRLSNILRKALIVNYYDKIGDDKSIEESIKAGTAIKTTTGGYIVKVPALTAPGVSATDMKNVLQSLDLWEHRFVWKEAKGRSNDTWYLIGERGEVTDPERPSQLIGWVSGDKVRLWDTSQALEPNWLTREQRSRDTTANPGAKVFSDKAVAAQALLSADTPDVVARTMVSEDIKYEARQWPPERSRYPLIEAKPMGRTNQSFQVAWIGGLFDTTTGQQVADAASVDSSGEQTRKLIRGLFTLDVVIVMDGTKSMSHLRPAAMEAVTKIVQQVRSQVPEGWKPRAEDVVTRCAVAIYRNRNDAATGPMKSFDFRPFERLEGSGNDQGSAKLMDFLNQITFDSRERTVREEGVLDGIVKAAQQAKLLQKGNPDAYKLMIVIGDSGDQGGGTTITEAAKVLNEGHYDFYAISVPKDEEIAARPDYKAFREQLAGLAGKLELPTAMLDPGQTFIPASRVLTMNGDLVAPILSACVKGVKVRNKIADVLANPKEYPMQLQAFVQSFLKDRVNMQVFKEHRQQVLGIGWTTQRDAKLIEQWKVMEYVERKALDAYRRFVLPFEQLDANADTLTTREIEDIVQSLKGSFQLGAAQYDPTRKISDVMGDAAKDLPVRSKLLSMTVPELQTYLGQSDAITKRERKLELERLKLCSKVLQAYIIDYEFSYRTDSNGRTIDITSNAQHSTSYWSQRGEFDYGWIPQDVFP